MMPRPSDRELHRKLYQMAASGAEITGTDLGQVIEWHNQAAARRCRDCPHRKKGSQ